MPWSFSLSSEIRCSNPDQPSGTLLNPCAGGPKICAQYSKHNIKNAYLKGIIPSLDLLTLGLLLIWAAQDCCITFCAAGLHSSACPSWLLNPFRRWTPQAVEWTCWMTEALFKSPYVFIAHTENWLTFWRKLYKSGHVYPTSLSLFKNSTGSSGDVNSVK